MADPETSPTGEGTRPEPEAPAPSGEAIAAALAPAKGPPPAATTPPAAEVSPPVGVAAEPPPETTHPTSPPTVFRAGGGRKFVLTVVLLVLMPFLVSLPVMILWRASAGHIGDAASLAIGGIVFVAAALFLLSHIVYSYRGRIEVGDDAVRLSVPRWRGPTPGLKYVKQEIKYSDLDRIETRGEIYKEIAVPTLLRSAMLTTKSGERVHLGYVHEASEDPAFPIREIADEISRRSGVPIGVKASVKVGSQYKALVKGTPPWDMAGDAGSPEHEMARAEYETLVHKNHVYMFYLAFILFGLAAIAFIVDIGRSGLLNSAG